MTDLTNRPMGLPLSLIEVVKFVVQREDAKKREVVFVAENDPTDTHGLTGKAYTRWVREGRELPVRRTPWHSDEHTV